MNAPEISIVIPVYKVEKYLRECIESVINQTFKNIEIILVDDGSPDNCPKICDEYANKDSRIRVIHKENGGYGTACNKGIEAARGKYIGLVESDDWIEPDMYEKLYKQIKKFDADMCTCSYFEYKSKSVYPNGTHDKPYLETINNTDDNKLFSIFDHPFWFTSHPSLWAKLYKSDLIKSIKFDERKGSSYQDAPFVAELFCKTQKIIALHEFLYHYRVDNENSSSSNARKDAKLMTILDQWQKAKEIIIKYGFYEQLKEEIYYHATKPAFRFYKNIDKKYKKQFFNKWRNFTKELINDKSFKFKYFNKEQKEFIQCVLSNNYRKTLNLQKKGNHNSILENIFSVKNNDRKSHKIVTFCGMKINIKRKSAKEVKIPQSQSVDKTNLNLYYLQKSNIQAAAIHPKTFSEYKNKYNGHKLVIVACGPTLKYYEPKSEAVHIGVNRSFMNKSINLDYLFIQDRLEHDMDAANAYLPNRCTKFYGILPELRFSQVKREILKVSNFDISQANAKIYIIEDALRRNWANNLEFEPIGDWAGCVFSALQFALYTNPQEIYLVGCDCTSNGHFYEEQASQFTTKNTTNLMYQKKSWDSFKQMVCRMYPNTPIISVNPVGLKGMFKDVYTQSYVDAHPELLKENIKILGGENLLNINTTEGEKEYV